MQTFFIIFTGILMSYVLYCFLNDSTYDFGMHLLGTFVIVSIALFGMAVIHDQGKPKDKRIMCSISDRQCSNEELLKRKRAQYKRLSSKKLSQWTKKEITKHFKFFKRKLIKQYSSKLKDLETSFNKLDERLNEFETDRNELEVRIKQQSTTLNHLKNKARKYPTLFNKNKVLLAFKTLELEKKRLDRLKKVELDLNVQLRKLKDKQVLYIEQLTKIETAERPTKGTTVEVDGLVAFKAISKELPKKEDAFFDKKLYDKIMEETK